MRAVAADWSGARSVPAQRRGIWVAHADDGVVRRHVGGLTREEAVDHVLASVDGGAQLVGLDFSFSFPAWFIRSLGATSGPEVWDHAAHHGERWLAACDPPFWGRPGRPRPAFGPGREEWRRTEDAPPAGMRRPKGTFQIGGAGAVGTGSVRGMPHLRRLRAQGIAVWPFDPVAGGDPVVVEVYPRWCTGPVVKSQPTARARHLAGLGRAIPPAARTDAAASEDAFDAVCAALALSVGPWAPPPTDDQDRLEGRICTLPGSGLAGTLGDEAQTVAPRRRAGL